jgi:sugar phosphate isomerase/epimerase
MYSNLNPRTMGLNRYPFPELLAAAVAAGFQGIEVPAGAFGNADAARRAKDRMSELGMRFGLIMAPCDLYRVSDDEFENGLRQFDEWSRLAKIAGCDRAYNHIWPGSDEREYIENYAWHIQRMQRVYTVLSDNGIRYGIEYMGAQSVTDRFRHPFIRTLMGTIALTRDVSAKIGFVFDTIHWYTSGSSQDDLYYAALHTGRIINLHLNDATPGGRESQDDAFRALPMENGIIDSARIVKLLASHGYDGPVILEPMKPAVARWEAMPLRDAVADAYSSLCAVFEAAGIIDGDT